MPVRPQTGLCSNSSPSCRSTVRWKRRKWRHRPTGSCRYKCRVIKALNRNDWEKYSNWVLKGDPHPFPQPTLSAPQATLSAGLRKEVWESWLRLASWFCAWQRVCYKAEEGRGGRAHLQQHPAVSIHIGPRILCLALLQEDVGHDLVQLRDQLEHGVLRQVLQRELSLTGVPRVSLPQHRVAVAGDNLQRTGAGENQSYSQAEIFAFSKFFRADKWKRNLF